MREKIEKAIYDNVMVGNLAGNVSLYYVDQAAVKILTLFRGEISKLENHQFGERWDGFELCRQKILAQLDAVLAGI